MPMLPPKTGRKHIKGQADHLDAWLISYADLITLLFMLFVIIMSVSIIKRDSSPVPSSGHQPHGFLEERSGLMTLTTPYDELYRNITGIVAPVHGDQSIAVEKSSQAVWLDIAAARFFENGSSDISKDQLPLIGSIARVLKETTINPYMIEVEGHTDDSSLQGGSYSDNWELAGLRAAHIVKALIEQGVPPEHLRAISYGGMHPLVPNRDSAGNPILQNRIRNQRIIIRLYQQS